MASSIHIPVDDKDLDDAELWAVIDSAAASHSSSSKSSGTPLALKQTNIQPYSPVCNVSPAPKFTRINHRNQYTVEEDVRVPADGEVLQEPWIHHRPRKVARFNSPVVGEQNQMVVRNFQRTPTTPTYSSPDCGRISVQELRPVSESPPFNLPQRDDKECMIHSLSGQFPSVSLFKDYQNAAMAILEKTDYTMISGSPYIKKTGWRKISFYFNLSFEIKDKSIEFDDNRNVQRAEFVVRAYMQGGRFSDGWGSCDRREKRFMKPNHDIPSTAETRAKNKACQDLLGIGEYRPGATNTHR